MTLEKMNEEINRLEENISESQKKRDELVEMRDREIMKQTQRVLAKHHISMNELIKLKNASADELRSFFGTKEDKGKNE